MNVSLKIGSVVSIPFGNTSRLSSDKPAIVKVEGEGAGVKITAVSVGEAKLTIADLLGFDVSTVVTVTL